MFHSFYSAMMAPNHRSSFGEQRVEGMFHHGLTADHTDESAIAIHHRQFLELLLGEDSGHLSNMLVGRGGNDLTRGDVHHLLAGERLHLGGHGFVVEHHHRRTGAGGNVRDS